MDSACALNDELRVPACYELYATLRNASENAFPCVVMYAATEVTHQIASEVLRADCQKNDDPKRSRSSSSHGFVTQAASATLAGPPAQLPAG
jgi:hypothetical protein